MTGSSIQEAINRPVADGQTVGIACGLLSGGQKRFFTAGHADTARRISVTPHTLFETGSISKVFTALLLARLCEIKLVGLDDPVEMFLPALSAMPAREGEICLLDLAMHVSGLPRLPGNFFGPRFREEDPYEHYDAAQLYDFLSQHSLARAVGEAYEYSNLGYGLLCHALLLRLGMTHGEAMKEFIFDPLGMAASTAQRDAGAAQGHDARLQPVPGWTMNVLAGAGGVQSTAGDLLSFMSAQYDTSSPLRAAMDSLTARRRPTTASGTDIALGWHISARGGREVIWHNGGTSGYRSFAAMDRDRETAVVLLANSVFDLDSLGFGLLARCAD